MAGDQRAAGAGGAGKARWLTLAACALIGLPAARLLLAGIEEYIAVGDELHIVQAVPLLLLIAASWRWPRVVGRLLVVLQPALLVSWFILVAREVGIVRGLELIVLMAPAILAGWLLLRAARARERA
jgi:hypothetical protein